MSQLLVYGYLSVSDVKFIETVLTHQASTVETVRYLRGTSACVCCSIGASIRLVDPGPLGFCGFCHCPDVAIAGKAHDFAAH